LLKAWPRLRLFGSELVASNMTGVSADDAKHGGDKCGDGAGGDAIPDCGHGSKASSEGMSATATALAGSRPGGSDVGFYGSDPARALPFGAGAILIAGIAAGIAAVAVRTTDRADIT
jgi:hypothetical protein